MRETEIREWMQGIFGIVCHRKQKEDGSESPETRRKELLEIFGVLTMKKSFFSKERVCSPSKMCSLTQVVCSFRDFPILFVFIFYFFLFWKWK